MCVGMGIGTETERENFLNGNRTGNWKNFNGNDKEKSFSGNRKQEWKWK